MKTIQSQSIVTRTLDIVAADMDGEVVMMSVKTGKYYNLGQIGGVIWELIEAPIVVSEIVDRLLDRYDVTPEQCEADVLSFLQSMYEQKLIVVR